MAKDYRMWNDSYSELVRSWIMQGAGFTMNQLEQEISVSTNTIQTHTRRIASELGVQLKNLTSKNKEVPIVICKGILPEQKKIPVVYKRFKCLCVVNGEKIWLSVRAENRDSVKSYLPPTVSQVLKVCDDSEYSKASETIRSRTSLPGNSMGYHVGKTRR